MTLTTHAVVGATAASLVPAHPVFAFTLAFLSHLAIDSLPHKDYQLSSIVETGNKLDTDMTLGKHFLLDLVRTGSDAFLGLLLSVLIFSVWLFHIPLFIVVLGAVGGVFPDFLQLVFFKTRSLFLLPLQKFHIHIQKGKTLEIPFIAGAFLQLILVSVLIVIRFTVLS